MSPANGAVALPSLVVFAWDASANADTYELCFDTSNNATCDSPWVTNLTGPGLAYVAVLAPGTTYYWQMRARNSAGTTDATGGWYSFATLALPGAFSKLGPANGAANLRNRSHTGGTPARVPPATNSATTRSTTPRATRSGCPA